MELQELEKLKKSLSRGALTTLSKRTQKSKAFITLVLKGLRNNDFIIDEAIALAKEEKAIQMKRKNEISNL
jgi:hypothetical protein